MPDGIGVYLHIPFCLSKCAYCDFNSRPADNPADVRKYLAALAREITLRSVQPAKTVYFGGGTPSLLDGENIAWLLDHLRKTSGILPDAEITLEMNPATADPRKIDAWARAGVNRISLGVQSTQNRWLRLLERPHTAEQAREAVEQVRDGGLTNISCDLIYGLPGQTLFDFQTDLQTLCTWRPMHISLYGLSVERGTRMKKYLRSGKYPAPDDDAAARMYTWSRNELSRQGFSQYELSNFSRQRPCRHNLVYWQGEPYLGLGAGAHSFLNGRRSWNIADPGRYAFRVENKKNAESGAEKLKGRAKIAEELIVRLRLTGGISSQECAERFGREWSAFFAPALQQNLDSGLLKKSQGRLRLTAKGMRLANVVFRALI